MTKLKGSRITGSRDAIFVRNRYQDQLDRVSESITEEINNMEHGNRRKMLGYYHKAEALRVDLQSHLAELNRLEITLEHLLEHDFTQEYKMWKDHAQGLSIRTKEGLGSNVVSILGSTHTTPALKYLEKYPEHSSHPNIQLTKKSLEAKLRDVRVVGEKYHHDASMYNHEIPYLEKNIRKCHTILERYDTLLVRGTAELGRCRYVNSLLFRWLPADHKLKMQLDTLGHFIEKSRSMLDLFESELSSHYRPIVLAVVEQRPDNGLDKAA